MTDKKNNETKNTEVKSEDQNNIENIEFDKAQTYKPEAALELVKKLHTAKFDASIELHFRLGIDPKKGDQQIRTAVSLPHGTGKNVKIAAFVSSANEKAVKEAGADIIGGEELIEEIKKTEKTDFEVAVAEPAMMKNLGKIAKILGTRGLMPSPKNETVTDDPVKAVKELKKGKVNLKNDATSNIHTVIGKISFDDNKLLENFKTIFDAVQKAKPAKAKGQYFKNIVLCSSMGPGVKVNISAE
ncbi:MAG TPA: 50S ribosomal protein L1 [Patescibacteria group bacterium]|nr:50S ribosomal protein L1 [Patescibacteria group bacterium]